ncbi:hypothetical protein V8C86DRAFT_2574567 [Haematococcus lacustris]
MTSVEDETAEVRLRGLSVLLSGLPSKGALEPDVYIHVRPGTSAPYICTHEGSEAPADQKVFTASDDAAFVRMLKAKQPAGKGLQAGSKPGQDSSKATASATGGKRAASTELAQPVRKKSAFSAALAAAAARPGSKADSGTAQPLAAAAGSGSSTAEGAAGARSATARPAAAALTAAVQGQDPGGSARKVFSQEELKSKPVKDLKELCKARDLAVSGTKEVLTQRLIEHQRRAKRAQQPS